MIRLASSAPLGLEPWYYTDEGVHGPTIAGLFAAQPALSRALDPVGVRQFLDQQPDGSRTCFATARLLPARCELWRNEVTCELRSEPAPKPRDEALLSLLEHAIARILASGRRIAVALSGGLDSALVLRLVDNAVPVFTLATELKGYSELGRTVASAEALGVQNLNVIRLSAEHFVGTLPEAITACETPLFNLHPVSKWLLARELRTRGFDAMLTGDGADQVFAGADPRNYLPIVGALSRAAGVPIVSPFLDPEVIVGASRLTIDPNKTALRKAASAVLPRELAFEEKTPRFCPDFDLKRYRDTAFETALATRLHTQIPSSAPGPEATLWATLALLSRQLGGVC